MSEGRRAQLALLIIGVLVVLALWLSSRALQTGQSAPLSDENRPLYALEGVRWTRLDEQGRPLLQAKATEVQYYDDRSARFEGLQLQRLGGSAGLWTLQAPVGLMPPGSERIDLERPVEMRGRLKNGDPVHVHAEAMSVDLRRRLIHSSAPVRLEAPYRQARARGLRADWEGTRVELLDQVEVEYGVKPRR